MITRYSNAWFLGVCLSLAVASFGATTALAAEGDYDGDGKTDIAVYYADGGTWYIARSTDGGLTQLNFGSSEQRPVLGDFDGDGKNDFAVFQRQTGNWTIRFSSNNSTVNVNFNRAEARPVVGDYDGDGRDDLALYSRPGVWQIRYSSNNSVGTLSWGWTETRACPGDYDGDGRTDLCVYHRRSGNWFITRSSDAQVQTIQWGWSQARPVPADYNGDGKTDIAVYHPASGNWYILYSGGLGQKIVNWGWLAARPAVGDFDGDGTADLSVYHRQLGDWYIFNSQSQTFRKQNWGWNKAAHLPAFRDGGIQNLIILAMGDSITYGSDSSSDGPETGYPMLLERRFEPLFGGHCVTINGGNPGEQTKDGRNRLLSLLNSYKPDMTLLMEGTNDTFFNVPFSTIEQNLRAMVASALQAGSSCIISTIPPVIKSAYRDRTAQERLIEQFNPRIPGIAAAYGILYVDNWRAITSQPNWQSALMDQETANHPNDAGYRIVRDTWLQGLEAGTMAGLYY